METHVRHGTWRMRSGADAEIVARFSNLTEQAAAGALGKGDDFFVIDNKDDRGDVITDFNEAGDDRIELGFWGDLDVGKHLTSDQLQISKNNQAEDADVRFIFRTKDATLWFDKDGSGDKGPWLVANLQDGAHLHANDIWLI